MKISIGGQLSASPIALGCMRMASLSVKEAERLVLGAVEEGIDFFDHADIYGGGKSEEIFGQVLRRNPSLRDAIVIQDKCGICSGYYDASKEHIIAAAENSLRLMGVEQMDVLLLHRPDALMEPEEVAEAFMQLRRDGKFRYFGVSNMNAAQIALIGSCFPEKLIANQLQFGLAHSGLVDEGINVNTAAGQAVERTGNVLDYCRLNRITIQAWSPLQYGMFEGPFLLAPQYEKLNAEIRRLAKVYGVSDEAIAVAWILRHPARMQVIAGTMNEKRLRGIAQADKVCLTREEWYALYRLAGNPLP